MPARRLPWFKLWPEAMRHEKIVALSDGAFRTWIKVLADGSEQAVRWRFASLKHAASVTGRPARHLRELIAVRLLDVRASGEVWVHDWRQWQDRYESDFAARAHAERSANAPRRLPGELRGEMGERDGERATSPQPPPQAEGERNPGRRSGLGGESSAGASPEVELPPIAPPTPGDVAVWNLAREALTVGWTPGNAEKIGRLEPLGRSPDGALWLRAPPMISARKYRAQLARALIDAGDAAGALVQILETGG